MNNQMSYTLASALRREWMFLLPVLLFLVPVLAAAYWAYGGKEETQAMPIRWEQHQGTWTMELVQNKKNEATYNLKREGIQHAQVRVKTKEKTDDAFNLEITESAGAIPNIKVGQTFTFTKISQERGGKTYAAIFVNHDLHIIGGFWGAHEK